MNAPKTPDAVADTAIELIPLDNIRPSRTHIQELRRKRFNQETLLELAANIREIGVQQPIVVRPVDPDGTVRFEIVFGERRYLASDRAGKGHVPAIVRALSDEQVLVAQIVENKHREDLNPLEEAVGYQDLKEAGGHNYERIGALIGKSESYVRARMKLLSLSPTAREALESGEIDYSKGLLIARFRSAKLQDKALAYASNEHFTYRNLFAQLRQNFMADLGLAPFSLDQPVQFTFKPNRNDSTTTEIGDRTICAGCPHNSANDPELQHDLGDAHVCTDRPCFEMKSKAHWGNTRAAAEAAGRTIISGKEAQAAIPPGYYGGINSQYLDLDATPQDSDSTYRQILGADAPAGLFAEESKGALHELVPVREAAKLLKAKGVKIIVPGGGSSHVAMNEGEGEGARADRMAEQRKEQEQRDVEHEFRKRLLRQIHAKQKGPLKRIDLENIAQWIEDVGPPDALEELYPEPIDSAKAGDDALNRFIVCALIGDETDYLHTKPTKMLEVAARLKIDIKPIRAQVVKDLKPTSAPAIEDEPKPPKKALVKKTPAKKKPAAKK